MSFIYSTKKQFLMVMCALVFVTPGCRVHAEEFNINWSSINQLALTSFFSSCAAYIAFILMIRIFGNQFIFNPVNQTNNCFEIIKSTQKTLDKDYVGFQDLPDPCKMLIAQLKDDSDKKKQFPIKGIILAGNPGIGKTYFVKCLAGEVKCPLIFCNAAELKDSFIGGSSKNVNFLVNTAYEIASNSSNGKVILFVDEADSIGSRNRSDHNAVSCTERDIVNTFLSKLDGLDGLDRLSCKPCSWWQWLGLKKVIKPEVIVIFATNNITTLDSALQRQGRFDYHITLPPLSSESQKELCTLILQKNGFNFSVDVDQDVLFNQVMGTEKASFWTPANIMGFTKMMARRAAYNEKTEIDLKNVVYSLKELVESIPGNGQDSRISIYEKGYIVPPCYILRDMVSKLFPKQKFDSVEKMDKILSICFSDQSR